MKKHNGKRPAGKKPEGRRPERKVNESVQFKSRFSLVVKTLGLDPYKTRLIDLFRDSMRLITKPKRELEVMTGDSKIGGLPDLPQDVPWPCNNGKPLAFIAQVNTCEIPFFGGQKIMPDKGILFFFYDPRDLDWGTDPCKKDCWRVFYVNNPQVNLKRTPFPEELEEEYRYSPTHIDMKKELTLPPMDSVQFERLRLDFDLHESYFDLHESYFDLLSALCVIQGFGEEDPIHRILGHPDQVKRNVNFDSELGSNGKLESGADISDEEATKLENNARDWRLLLQIDSDPSADMKLGNYGKLYFMIKADDLAKRAFDKTWLVFQDFAGEFPDESEDVQLDDNFDPRDFYED